MQQLFLHPAWDKTISEQDRALIEKLFEESYTDVRDLIMSPLIRAAFNHKQELLITVLIHNFTHHSVAFRNRAVLISSGEYYFEQQFTIPDLTVAPFTSMPWTFIFEPNHDFKNLDLVTIQIEIDE